MRLGELLLDTFSGEWGTEEGESLTPVLRTSNFNEDGSLDYSTPAMRCIPERKVAKKRMVRGDIILEKSGGTPKRPVGIMAFYDSDELALCSNFNQVLRFDEDRILPRFAFYQLRWLKDRNAFDRFTRKTTGLQNLQMKRLIELKLHVPQIEAQTMIADTLDKIVDNQRILRREIIDLDLLVKSRFVEMFGDAGALMSRWPKMPLAACVNSIDSGKSVNCKSEARTGSAPGVLKLSALSSGKYLPEENKAMFDGESVLPGKEVMTGDILVARKNTPDLVGTCVMVDCDVPNLMFPDLVFRMHPIAGVDGTYLSILLGQSSFSETVRSLAHGSAKSMSNIPKSELRKLEIPFPPLALQREFANFVIDVDKLRFEAQKQKDELQTLYDSLAQEYFAI